MVTFQKAYFRSNNFFFPNNTASLEIFVIPKFSLSFRFLMQIFIRLKITKTFLSCKARTMQKEMMITFLQ